MGVSRLRQKMEAIVASRGAVGLVKSGTKVTDNKTVNNVLALDFSSNEDLALAAA